MSVDGAGKLNDVKVVSEDPPNMNFGRAALVEYSTARFIPGFRNGKAVSANFRYTSYIRVTMEPSETRLRASLIPES
ncbi:hypothetical protein BH18VER1_BH18VER1_10160 [soil metagenome]